VNTLSPGAVDTPIIDGQFATKAEADGARDNFSQMTPLGRIGHPEEMATAILFLASDDSSYSTGIDLIADGGLTQVGRSRGACRGSQRPRSRARPIRASPINAIIAQAASTIAAERLKRCDSDARIRQGPAAFSARESAPLGFNPPSAVAA
jgi:Enoyl-(Acyl carrier protein) reductase